MRPVIALLFIMLASSCVMRTDRSIMEAHDIFQRTRVSQPSGERMEEQRLRERVRTHPYDAEVRRKLGEYYLNRANRPVDALREFEVYARLKPSSPLAHFLAGLAYLNLGEKEKAVSELERAIECDRSYAPPYYALSRVYEQLGDEERANVYRDEYAKLKMDAGE